MGVFGAADKVADCAGDGGEIRGGVAEKKSGGFVGRKIYKRFYAELLTLDRRKWKIEDWDAGWYQVRMALGARIDLSALGEKLLPQIYELGFLRDELIEFT